MSDLFDKCFSFSRNPVVSENGVELSLAEAISSGIYPFFKAISSMNGPHCTVDGRDMIMVGSNNYLGLTTHPKVKEAAMRALQVRNELFGLPVPQRHSRSPRTA